VPFQSEKQRRYLWANEPEIARDWADTYGSRIEKNDGGIMRTGFRVGAAATGGMKGTSDRGMSTGNVGGNGSHDRGGNQHRATAKEHYNSSLDRGGDRHKDVAEYGKDYRLTANRPDKNKTDAKEKAIQHKKFKNFVKRNKWKNLKQAGVYGKTKLKGLWGEVLSSLNPDDEVENFDVDSIREIASRFGGDLTKTQVKGLGGFRKDLAFQEKDNPTQKEFENYYGLNNPPNRDNQALPNYYAPRDVHPGTGVTEVVEEETPSRDFEMGGELQYADYGTRAHGLSHNVDERMLPEFANGGRIPAAYGGIMDSSTGRRAYGLGSIFKSIKKAAGKVLKSPIGKAALLAGLGMYGTGTGLFGSSGMFSGAKGAGFLKGDILNKLLMKNTAAKGLPAVYDGLSLGKAAIWGSSLLPWLLPGPEEDDEGDKGSNYDVLRDKYASQLMNIKRGVRAGSLDPNEFSYLPADYTYTGAEGGRAGFYAGGQSIPSDYTMEDAMMTTTQDKLGGITDVMKQADLFRQGSVGQMYAADGGRIGFAYGMNEKLAELKKAYNTYVKGGGTLSFEKFSTAFAEENFAQGGRSGADEGGLMDLGGMEKDYRQEGGFVPLGGEEKADDVPARLSKNEFVFTADAVRGAGGGDIDKGAEIMENIMKNLEQGGQISEETQGLSGAQEMFGVSERLSEVV